MKTELQKQKINMKIEKKIYKLYDNFEEDNDHYCPYSIDQYLDEIFESLKISVTDEPFELITVTFENIFKPHSTTGPKHVVDLIISKLDYENMSIND